MADPLKGNSVSFWETFFGTCERRAFLNAVFPERDEDKGPALLRGIKIHDVFEDVCNRRLKVDSWGAAAASVTMDAEARHYVDRMLSHVVSGGWPAPREGGVEKWFRELPLGELGTIPWRGKIDLISETAPLVNGGQITGCEERLCVVDWKTINSRERIKSEWEARRALQLPVYCLATGIRTACYVYLLPHGKPFTLRVDFTEKELDRHRMWIYNQYSVLKSRWAQLIETAEECDRKLEEYPNWKEVFSLASPEERLCNEKWCRHWKHCLGADHGIDR